MASKRQFGIFWGPEFLSVAETQRSQLVFSAIIPRQIENATAEGEPKLTASQENIQLTASLQRLVRDQNITRPQIRLSLPTRDVIFRSFVLPAMSPAETNSAVVFEAPRYTPFKLEELYYTYCAVPFLDNGVKKNQILFLAIKQDRLNQYCKIIEDAQMEILSIEPSVIGLLRILQLKKLINADETIAIIQVLDTHGTITVVNQQAPYLIRDFNIFSAGTDGEEQDYRSMLTRLGNEIRISFEFYARQIKTGQEGSKIRKIYLFANQNARETTQGLQDDLGIETIPIEINEVFSYQNELHPNMANAIGASLADSVDLSFDLNLETPRSSKHSPERSQAGLENILKETPNYKTTSMIAGVCFLIIGAAFGFTQWQSLPQQKRLSDLKNFNQKYQSMSLETIKKSSDDIINKISTYGKLSFQSYMATYLENISRSLLNGIWLTNLEISFAEPTDASQSQNKQKTQDTKPKIKFVLNGYSYNEDLNQQISLIEEFLAQLKENSFFKKHAKEIVLKQVKKEELSDFPVTFFQILIETDETNG